MIDLQCSCDDGTIATVITGSSSSCRSVLVEVCKIVQRKYETRYPNFNVTPDDLSLLHVASSEDSQTVDKIIDHSVLVSHLTTVSIKVLGVNICLNRCKAKDMVEYSIILTAMASTLSESYSSIVSNFSQLNDQGSPDLLFGAVRKIVDGKYKTFKNDISKLLDLESLQGDSQSAIIFDARIALENNDIARVLNVLGLAVGSQTSKSNPARQSWIKMTAPPGYKENGHFSDKGPKTVEVQSKAPQSKSQLPQEGMKQANKSEHSVVVNELALHQDKVVLNKAQNPQGSARATSLLSSARIIEVAADIKGGGSGSTTPSSQMKPVDPVQSLLSLQGADVFTSQILSNYHSKKESTLQEGNTMNQKVNGDDDSSLSSQSEHGRSRDKAVSRKTNPTIPLNPKSNTTAKKQQTSSTFSESSRRSLPPSHPQAIKSLVAQNTVATTHLASAVGAEGNLASPLSTDSDSDSETNFEEANAFGASSETRNMATKVMVVNSFQRKEQDSRYDDNDSTSDSSSTSGGNETKKRQSFAERALQGLLFHQPPIKSPSHFLPQKSQKPLVRGGKNDRAESREMQHSGHITVATDELRQSVDSISHASLKETINIDSPASNAFTNGKIDKSELLKNAKKRQKRNDSTNIVSKAEQDHSYYGVSSKKQKVATKKKTAQDSFEKVQSIIQKAHRSRGHQPVT